MAHLVRTDQIESAAPLRARHARSGGIAADTPRILQRFSARVAVLEGGSPAGPFDNSGLDENELLAVRAWMASQTPRAPQPVHAWDANAKGKLQPPVHLHKQNGEGDAAEAPEPPRYLVGSVAVGLVIVSGPDNLKVSDAEATKVVQEVTTAATFLTRAEPRAAVSFDYDIQRVDVSIGLGTVGSSTDPYERLESPWRDAALAEMGYSSGRAGYRGYTHSLKASKQTDWAYVAFFTKYSLNHFAYAVYEKVVMHYDNDGWGPDNIHAVFAHETCHIFGAADEYGSCGCYNTYGILNEPNGNCVACPAPRVSCLMDRNELVLCKHSRRQLGWGAPYVV